MKRLYLRMYVAVLISLFLSNIIAFAFNDSKWKELKSQDAIEQTQGIEKLILRDVNSKLFSLDQSIKEWDTLFGYDLAIVNIEQLNLDLDHNHRLASKVPIAIISHVGWRIMYEVYRPLNESTDILYISWLDSSNPKYDFLTFLNFTIPLVLAAFIVFFLVRPIKNDLTYLLDVCESYAAGNFEEKITPLPAPFNHLATTLSSIANKMLQVVNEQNEFSFAITHELRTPLAKLRLALDLTRTIDSASELRNHIQEMDNDIDELESLVTELLSYAHFSNEESKANLEELEVTSVLIGLAKEIEPLKPEIKIEACATCFHADLFADPAMLRQAVSNLLINAQRYAATVIKINVYKTSTSLEIWVEDDGPGIPNHLKQTIFQPFYRFTRNEQDRGYGLGLTIVHKIMEKHEGEVLAAKSIMGGANFILRFPNTLADNN